MKTYIKSASCFLLLMLFSISLTLPLLAPRISAQSPDLLSQLRKEGDQFTVTQALVMCFGQGTNLNPTVETPNLASSVPIFITGDDARVGHHVKSSDGTGKCNDGKWVADALSLVGITTHSDVMDLFYEKDGNYWYLKDKYSGTNGTAIVSDFLELSKNRGNTMVTCTARVGCTVTPLSSAARYVLLLENLQKGCGAKEISGADAVNSIDSDHRATITYINENGTDSQKIYKMEKGKGDTISVGYGITNDGKYTCGTLINMIDDSAKAYQTAVNAARDAGQNIGGDVADTSSTGDTNEPSCEENTKLSSGWIVCSILELLSDGMDKMLGYIDSMLNVDVAQLDTDSSLRSSWSYFRAIATFMLVAVGLVMIISQAIGGGN